MLCIVFSRAAKRTSALEINWSLTGTIIVSHPEGVCSLSHITQKTYAFKNW